MTIYLVRHARAGNRKAWNGDDELRPLSKVGRRQAEALVGFLADAPLDRIVSSPFVRSRQTVEPLAQARRLPVDLSDALAEGAPGHETLRLLEKVADEDAALCTHGDVITTLLDHFSRHGVRLPDTRLEKGSIWALDVVDRAVVGATYHPPPD
jgi:8-oxo-dGTP diphosphatase